MEIFLIEINLNVAFCYLYGSADVRTVLQLLLSTKVQNYQCERGRERTREL